MVIKNDSNSNFITTIQKHGFALGSLLLVASGTFSYYLDIRPFAPDDLLWLSFGTISSPVSLLTGSVVEWVPAFRPVSTLSIWLQYQLVGIEPITYYLFNIVVLLCCTIFLYFIVFIFTQSRLSSFIAALFMLVDIRVATSLYWINDRQNSLAVLFGAAAILLFLYSAKSKMSISTAFWIVLLLFLSASSKEYGLAFAGSLIFFTLLLYNQHWKSTLLIVLSVLVIYFGLRFGVARNDLSLEYCEEEVGYRDKTVSICYSDYSISDRLKFYTWNSGSTFIGTFLPNFYSVVGQWKELEVVPGYDVFPKNPISSGELLFMILTVGLVGMSFYKFPRISLSLLSIIFFNSILSFLLFRYRNHFVGLVGLYGLFGIGFYSLWSVRSNRIFYNLRVYFLVPILFLFASVKASGLSHYLEFTALKINEVDNPCTDIFNHPYSEYFDMDIVNQLREKYEIDTECFDGE